MDPSPLCGTGISKKSTVKQLRVNRFMSLDRAKKIKIILFDVDGVLTDGSSWLFPAPVAAPRATDAHREQKGEAPGFGIQRQNMVEAKGFNAHDGTAISLARL